jgi:hypothetical protein
VVPSNVKLVKCPVLDEIDQGLFENALSHFFKKVGQGSVLQLSFKEYARGGLKAQHEVHGKLLINGKEFFASAEDWQFLGVVQRVLKKLEREVLRASERK